MKNRILFIVFTLAALNVGAQTGFHVGLNAGYNSVWIVNQNMYGYKELNYTRTFGFIPGIALGYNLNDNMGVQLEFNIAPLGQDYFDVSSSFSLADDGQGKRLKVETFRYVDLKYLQIPIMYRYQSTRSKKQIISYHFMLGPTVGILLSADQQFEADVLDDGNLVSLNNNGALLDTVVPQFKATTAIEPTKDYFSNIDFGFLADAGVDIYVSDNLYITPAIRAYYGLTDLNSKPTRVFDGYAGSHNFYGGIYVGIHYIFKKEEKK